MQFSQMRRSFQIHLHPHSRGMIIIRILISFPLYNDETSILLVTSIHIYNIEIFYYRIKADGDNK